MMKLDDAKTFVAEFPYKFLRAYSYVRKPVNVETEEGKVKGPKHPSRFKNRRTGVVVAVRIKNEIYYGWSLCNRTFDTFDSNVGVAIALKRAIAVADPNYYFKGYPQSIVDTMVDMEYRASRYFKDCTV